MLTMTLMPDASCCEQLACLAGLLADVPFALEWTLRDHGSPVPAVPSWLPEPL